MIGKDGADPCGESGASIGPSTQPLDCRLQQHRRQVRPQPPHAVVYYLLVPHVQASATREGVA